MTNFLVAATTITTVFLIVVAYQIGQASSTGLGDLIIQSSDTTGGFDELSLGQDLIFGEESQGTKSGLLEWEAEFVELISKVPIKVVNPGKDLLKTMNVVITHAKALFLKEHEYYFDQLKLQTTSRPMLLALVAIRLLGQDKLLDWYRPIGELKQEQVVSSCKSMLRQRNEAFIRAGLPDLDKSIVACQFKSRARYRCAYLVYQGNIELFMLETYLALCSTIEGARLAGDLEDFKSTVQ